MARYLFGGGAADWLYVVDDDGRLTLPEAGTPITFWTDVVVGAGTQYPAAADGDSATGLLDPTGTPIDHVAADANGRLPARSVQGPDGVTRMAMDASGGAGPRAWVYPDDPVALSVAAAQLAQQAQQTANAALSQSGGGGGTVTKVAGKSPDGTGNVVLTAADLQALIAGAGNAVALGILDQFLRIDISDEDNATSPNRLEFAFQGALTSYFNEYGEFRAMAARSNTTPMRSIANSAGQTADLYQACDNDRNPLGGFRANGAVYGPNVGTGRLFRQAAQPADAVFGDAWVDTSGTTPKLKLYDGSVWQVIAGGGGGPTPAEAPAFVDADVAVSSGTTHTAPDVDGDTLLILLAWNSTAAPTATPPGWTLVDDMPTASGRAQLYVAAGTVTSLSWTWAASLAVSSVILGYEASSIVGHAPLPDTGGDAVHTAPDLDVDSAPARIVRFWWDKTAITAAQAPTLPAGVTQRALQAPTSGSRCTVLAADAEQASAGAAGTVDATYTLTANNAGGFTVALAKA